VDYRRILVFGAHPDDEMTMAGTMRKLSDRGVQVHVCISTDGCEGYPHPEWKSSIVAMRQREQAEADQVMGVFQRHQIGSPDMGLENDKATFLRFIEVVRKVRPDAAFTHGPHDHHRDHIRTGEISLEALWQAGQPVSAELGEPWVTPHIYYYKGVQDRPPQIVFDCRGYAHVATLARATQESQMVLFRTTREALQARARMVQEENPPHSEKFWLTDRMTLNGFPASG
jgi:LmbE family N-acetylglucosaminyl deacetylase